MPESIDLDGDSGPQIGEPQNPAKIAPSNFSNPNPAVLHSQLMQEALNENGSID